ncbi:MAG: hypothetical protein IJD51_02545 [Clostridia bacterium]|nr:hypothetical protein [Clostridia bacterium]
MRGQNNSQPLGSVRPISYARITLSLILLFNIPFGVLDLLFDFVAYFILASQLKEAARRATYFAEATDALRKLALLNLLKLPILIFISASRGGGSYGYDIYAVLSLGFGVFDVIWGVSAVRYIFDGLFRLGERTDASALISPIRLGSSEMSTDTLKVLTLIFAVAKPILAALPDMFRLTSTNGYVSAIVVSPYYIYVLIIAQLLGTAFGIFWLVCMVKYVKAIKKEGQIEHSLEVILTDSDRKKFASDSKIANLKSILTALAISSFLLIDLKFSGNDNINLLPDLIHGIFLIYIAVRLGRVCSARAVGAIISSSVYTALALVYYIFETRFLYYEGYDSLVGLDVYSPEYTAVEILSVVECVSLIVALVFIYRMLHGFIFEHTGTSPLDVGYSAQEKRYHTTLTRFNLASLTLGVVAAVAKCVDVFSKAHFKLEFNLTASSAFIPVIEWMGLAAFICYAAYIALTLYYTSVMKDEVEMKYKDE